MAKYFVDTNVLLRLADETSPSHELVTRAVKKLLLEVHRLCIGRQSLAEFWAVATREKTVNGLGWTPSQTKHQLEVILESFVLIQVPASVQLLELLEQHAVMGKQVHDANLVLTMLQNQIDFLLTINVADFKRFENIKAIHPSTILEKETP
jgi:predicted nucleic acid-binding protein